MDMKPKDKYAARYPTIDLKGGGDQAAMHDYINGNEQTGPFPLGHIPTDWKAVNEAMLGKGLGEARYSSGTRNPDRG